MTARETNLANAFETTLSAQMNPTDLTATVVTTSGGPTSPCYLVIEPDSPTQREYVYCDASFTGTTFVTSGTGNRYLSGSAAGSGLTHPAGSVVRCAPVKQHWDDINDRVDLILKVASVTAGDLLYVSSVAGGQATFARLGKGTALQGLRMNSGATAPEWATGTALPTTAVFYSTHTWALSGAIAVPSGDTDFINPMYVAEGANETVVLDKVRYKLNSGTSATFKLQVAGSDATGFTGLSATTTATTTNPTDVAVSDTDAIVPVVTAVSGLPVNLTITIFLKRTVTLT